MLSQRLTSGFEVVCMLDSAFDDFTYDEMRKYGLSRNIKDIDISKCEFPPTVFECMPLMPKWEHLIDAANTMESSASWSIFRHHVKGAKNFKNDAGQNIISIDNDKIDDKCRDFIPIDIVTEIAAVIIGKACIQTKGFTMPPTFLEQRARSQARRAMTAGGKTANQEDITK